MAAEPGLAALLCRGPVRCHGLHHRDRGTGAGIRNPADPSVTAPDPLPDAHFTVDIVLEDARGNPAGPHWQIPFAQVLLPRAAVAPDPAARLVLRRGASGALDL